MVLTFQQIMEVNDLKIEPVNVPEWGGDVGLRRMSAAQTIEMMTHFADRKKADPNDEGRDFAIYILSKTIADDAGNTPFDSDDGRVKLGSKSHEVIDRLANVAVKINAATKETVEEKAKNLETPPADSSSGSPQDSATPSASS